jgi:hypothetical protein
MKANAFPFRAFGILAVTGGAARLVASFVPWQENSLLLEAFYLTIDLCLLFGLTGFYVLHAGSLGAAGFVAYLIWGSGIALIAGPDGEAFGANIYQAGVGVIAVGALLLSGLLLMRRISPRAAPLCWLGAVAVSAIGAATGFADIGFAVGGVLFGAGYIAAGAWQIRQGVRLAPPARDPL